MCSFNTFVFDGIFYEPVFEIKILLIVNMVTTLTFHIIFHALNIFYNRDKISLNFL